MKTLFKVIGSVLGLCFVIVVISMTVALVRAVSSSGGFPSGDVVAVIDVKGVIWNSSEFLRKLKDIEENASVKALVVRIDSPGGLVAPSQEIYRSLRNLDEKIPVIASMASVAASGGYYSALGARKIYANSGTLTASIGVIMEFVNNSELYQWAKMKRYTLKAGKFKDVGSTLRDMKPEERALMQGLLDSIHREFKDTVMERRGLKEEQIVDVTDGRILTGGQAVKAGLVDVLGGLPEALSEARELGGLDADAEVLYPEAEEGLMKKLVFGKWQSIAEELGVSPILAPQGWQVMLLPSVLY